MIHPFVDGLPNDIGHRRTFSDEQMQQHDVVSPNISAALTPTTKASPNNVGNQSYCFIGFDKIPCGSQRTFGFESMPIENLEKSIHPIVDE